jgi:hypothetical protein
MTIRRYSKKIICLFHRMFIVTSHSRLLWKINKKLRSCKTIWINQKTLNELKQTHLSISERRILTHRKCSCSIWTNDSSKRNIFYEIVKNFKSLKKSKRKFVLWNKKLMRFKKSTKIIESKMIKFFSNNLMQSIFISKKVVTSIVFN